MADTGPLDSPDSRVTNFAMLTHKNPINLSSDPTRRLFHSMVFRMHLM